MGMRPTWLISATMNNSRGCCCKVRLGSGLSDSQNCFRLFGLGEPNDGSKDVTLEEILAAESDVKEEPGRAVSRRRRLYRLRKRGKKNPEWSTGCVGDRLELVLGASISTCITFFLSRQSVSSCSCQWLAATNLFTFHSDIVGGDWQQLKWSVAAIQIQANRGRRVGGKLGEFGWKGGNR